MRQPKPRVHIIGGSPEITQRIIEEFFRGSFSNQHEIRGSWRRRHWSIPRRHPGKGLLHHSDRGVQYAALDYRELLAAHKLTVSMSRRANCYDNAVAESFFATLKWELLDGREWPTRAAARKAIFEYIEVWYNRQRRHSTLDYLSPWQYEQRILSAAA